jgi:chemotaxis protein MotB
MRKILCVACLCVLGQGCVTKTKYEALAAERDRVTAELAADHTDATRRDAEARELLRRAQAALDSCDRRALDLEQIGRRRSEDVLVAEQEALALAADLDRLQRQLAQVLRDKSRLGASVEEMHRALAALQEREREAKLRVNEYRDVVARFKDLIDAGKLQVRVVDGRMVLTLSMDILFPSGSAKLSPEGRESLLELGQRLAAIPGRRFQVEGHTDTVPIHTSAYPSNWELASARAMIVLRVLLDAGIEPGRVSAASFGEHRPAADNVSDAGKATNRRIEVVLVPDLSSLPGYTELRKLAGG